MSDLFVDNIKHQSSQGSGTITLGTSGEKITTASGAEFSAVTGHMYPAFEAYLSANTTVTDGAYTKMPLNTELFDTDGYYDNSTNYRFTPLVSGKYFAYAQAYGFGSTSNQLVVANVAIYKNGTLFYVRGDNHTTNYAYSAMPFGGVVIDMNGTTDYLEAYAYVDSTSGTAQLLSGGKSSKFGAYRIGS